MKFKTLIASLLWLMTVQISPAQVIGSVDFDAIKKAIQDPASPYYYPTLLERWQRQDTTLKLEEVRHLYYGSVFQPGYDPEGYASEKQELATYISQEDYAKAVVVGDKLLTIKPISLLMLKSMGENYIKTGNQNASENCRWKFFQLLDVINASGNGCSCDSAWVFVEKGDALAWFKINNIDKQGQLIEVEDCSKYTCAPTTDWKHDTAWINLKITRDFIENKKRFRSK